MQHEKTIFNPSVLLGDSEAFVSIMSRDVEDKFRYILVNAQRRIEEKRHDEMCKRFHVLHSGYRDDDGGGSDTYVFPHGWNADHAEAFLSKFLERHFYNTYGGPGRYFCNVSTRRSKKGRFVLTARYGLDI